MDPERCVAALGVNGFNRLAFGGMVRVLLALLVERFRTQHGAQFVGDLLV